jgi:hypothetical protein
MSILLFMTGGQLSEYEGDVTFTLGPESSYGYEFPPVVGTVEVSLQPGASQYSIEHAEIGHVQVSLLPQGQGAIEHHEIGNVEIVLHTLRSIHYADYVYQGNIGFSLSPGSGYIHDFPPVAGALGLALTPQSPYAQGWDYQGSILLALAPASSHFADYLCQGNIPIALIPASGHFADYVLVGAIQLSLNPSSPCVQDFSYPGNAISNILPASSFINDFSYQGAVVFLLLPRGSILLDRGKDFLILDAPIIREILLEAVISKNRLFIASGVARNREAEACISKTLAYRTAMKKEATSEAGR